MINSYLDYISTFLKRSDLGDRPVPGEHHFVATYLVPLLYQITEIIPDYVNPDGMKAVKGDIVYYSNDRHTLGLEVKLGTISLSKNEFNNWIVQSDKSLWPEVFIGIDTLGMIICPWSEFRQVYLQAINANQLNQVLEPIALSGKYGPRRKINTLISLFAEKYVFNYDLSDTSAKHQEQRVSECIRCLIKPYLLFY